MATDDIQLLCPNCEKQTLCSAELYDTFNKVRCNQCNYSFSLVPFKLTQNIEQVRKLVNEPRTTEWAEAYAAVWEYIFRNRSELSEVDQEFLFDTCLHLYRFGVTFVQGYVDLAYEERSVILSLLTDVFDPSPYLPSNYPEFSSYAWRVLFSVHHRVLEEILELGEDVLHFELGTLMLGYPRRLRVGTIVLTNKRVIVIGREKIAATGLYQLYIKYPGIRSFSVDSYKALLDQSEPVWRYLITPEPLTAAIYASHDYFDLEHLTRLKLKKDHLDCTFKDQEYIEFKPREYYIPIKYIKDIPIGLIGKKLDPKEKHKTGDFKIEIILAPGQDERKDALKERYKRLEEAVKAAAESSVSE